MKGTSACAGWFGTIDVEIHHHRILPASDHHSFAELIRQRVDLLMRHVRRHIDKISRTSLLAELELLAPPHSRPSPNNIKHRFKLAVVMRSCLRVRLDHDGSRPQLARAGASMCD